MSVITTHTADLWRSISVTSRDERQIIMIHKERKRKKQKGREGKEMKGKKWDAHCIMIAVRTCYRLVLAFLCLSR
jgi:hypothetical protein